MSFQSCSNDSRNDPSPKSKMVQEAKICHLTDVWVAQLNNQTSKPVMVNVVRSIQVGGNFIFY